MTSGAPAPLSLQPTELQPRPIDLTAREELREELTAIGSLAPDDPMFTAVLLLALSKLARRLDAVEAALEAAHAPAGSNPR